MEKVVFVTGDLEEMRQLSGVELIHQIETLLRFCEVQSPALYHYIWDIYVEDIISCFHVVSSSFSPSWMTAL